MLRPCDWRARGSLPPVPARSSASSGTRGARTSRGVCPHRSARPLRRRARGETGAGLHELERELAPEYGRDADGALVSGVEPVDSCGQDVLHGRGHRPIGATVGLLSCGSSEFLQEEGVSLAPTDDLLGGVVRVAEDRCDDLFAGLPREGPEGDLGYERLAKPRGVVTRAVCREQENRDGGQFVDEFGKELL